jgi:hypothetical protein
MHALLKRILKNLDLYSFPVPMEAQPLAVTQLKGSLERSGKENQ